MQTQYADTYVLPDVKGLMQIGNSPTAVYASELCM